jgi:hypothetical protein
MRARRFAHPLVWLLALLFVLPLAGVAGECDDCVAGGGEPGCCPPSCSLCVCCTHGQTVLTGAPGTGRGPGVTSPAGGAITDALSSVDPRDVFHVPKPFLV